MIDKNKEWDFIMSVSQNLKSKSPLEKELIFILQTIFIPDSEFHIDLYLKTKEMYLKLSKNEN